MAVRVVIVEQDPERRSLFRAHLQTIPGVEVVGVALDAERALELCTELQPEIVVIGVDADRPVDGAINRLRESCADLKVLAVASPRAVTTDTAGADAVLVRPIGSDTFVATLVELVAVST